MQLKKQVRGCPLCGGRGREVKRKTVIRDRKLVDLVAMTCGNHSDGKVAWVEEDHSITDYSNDPDTGISHDELLAHRQKVWRGECHR